MLTIKQHIGHTHDLTTSVVRRLGLAPSIGPQKVGVLFYLMTERLQSPKHRVFFIKDRRWITSKKFVISTCNVLLV
jgi:hypothetical protein